ncbi:MAG TPA: methyltransferase [Candidatus Dormibacteraeota bacterium]|nr:methyltransferase [Candidatus Dormibacteraeota bacterium]
MPLDNPRAEESAIAAPPPGVGPERIFEIATGFMAARHLFAAGELGLFEALADGPATIDELATRMGLSRRVVRISADAMSALGLLERRGDAYQNGDVTATFLAGRTPADLRPFLRFFDRISYPAWTGLATALRTGPHQGVQLDDEMQAVFSAGVEAITAGPAAALAATYDFGRHRRLLDVGGGTGSWSAAVARQHPHMEATVFDVSAVAGIARDRLAEQGFAARIDVASGDVMTGPLPRGHDVVLLANLIHYWSPEKDRSLLQRVRNAVEIGDRLLIADFWTDPTHTVPLMAALMAGEFAVICPEGDVYSLDEARGWLAATGWRFVEHGPLAGPISLVVAEAV